MCCRADRQLACGSKSPLAAGLRRRRLLLAEPSRAKSEERRAKVIMIIHQSIKTRTPTRRQRTRTPTRGLAGLRVGLGVRLRVRLSRRSLISRVRRLGVRVGGLGLAGLGVGELESSAHPSPPPPPGRLVTQSVPPECLPAALFLNCRLPRWRPLLFSGLRRCPVRHRRGLAQLRARARARAVASAGPCTSSFSSET